MATKITATELARNLSDILNRTRYKGESFVIERGGEPVAKMDPPPKPIATLRDLFEFVRDNPPDDKFADDLEAIHKEMNQPLPPPPEWPSCSRPRTTLGSNGSGRRWIRAARYPDRGNSAHPWL